MNDPVISVRGLVKEYGKGATLVKALRGVDLDIPRGSFTCIVGPSGHGKSTLMHLLGGLDHPTSGTVLIDGQEMSCLGNEPLANLRAQKIGFVFQFFNLLKNLTVSENIETALMLAGIPEKEQKSRVKELLKMIGLEDKADARPGELSGGQQQRVAIARALANNPPVLLMDEPTGNLDTEAEQGVMKILGDLKQKGKTIVFVTHSNEIASKADNLVYVRDGRILDSQGLKMAS